MSDAGVSNPQVCRQPDPFSRACEILRARMPTLPGARAGHPPRDGKQKRPPCTISYPLNTRPRSIGHQPRSQACYRAITPSRDACRDIGLGYIWRARTPNQSHLVKTCRRGRLRSQDGRSLPFRAPDWPGVNAVRSDHRRSHVSAPETRDARLSKAIPMILSRKRLKG